MALDLNTQQRIELLVGYDKSTYNKTQKALQNLFQKRVDGEITLPEGALDKLAEKFLEASQAGGRGSPRRFRRSSTPRLVVSSKLLPSSARTSCLPTRRAMRLG